MRRVLLLALPALALSGCKHQPTLVGSWTWENDIEVRDRNMPTRGQETFLEDGMFRSIARIEGAGGRVLVSSHQGTWKLDGNLLTEKVLDIHWDVEGNTRGSEAIRAALQSKKKTLLEDLNKHPTVEITWVTDDLVKYVLDSKTYRLFRKKDR